MGIIILIIKEFIRIPENKYNYSNKLMVHIEERVKLQAGIEPVKGEGMVVMVMAASVMMVMMAGRCGVVEMAPARRPVLTVVEPPLLPLGLVPSSMVVEMEQQWR